jgi:hypothetical protein
MKNKKSLQYVFYLTIFLTFFLGSCTEFEEPGLIYDPNRINTTKSPAIDEIIPGGSAVAGVREITILGKNFIPRDTIWVQRDTVMVPRDSAQLFIGGRVARLKSISDSVIIAYRPPNYGQLIVEYVIPNADAVSNRISYNVERPITELVGYENVTPFVMDIDRYDTAWVCKRRIIYKVDPSGINLLRWRSTDLPAAFLKFWDAKFGKGGYLYLIVDLRTGIYRLNRNDTLNPVVYATLPMPATYYPRKMDVDENGNIYAGGSNGLYLVDTNRVVTTVGDYTTGSTFGEIRVIKDASNNRFVYALVGPSNAIADSQKYNSIYRSAINSDGTLGARQLVVRDSVPAGSTITSFNIRNDGQIYLALKSHPQYYLFVVEANGSITPFYTENILPSVVASAPVDQLVWGHNNNILYLNRSKYSGGLERVYRMGMESNGAPYLGRDLN